MNTVHLSDKELDIIHHALRVAIEQFKNDANIAQGASYGSLANQSIKQVRETEEVADRLQEQFGL